MPDSTSQDDHPAPGRRAFLGTVSSAAMIGGLVTGYGACAAMGTRFLYPARPRRTGWMFVTDTARLRPGQSLQYRAPNGERVAVARMGDEGGAGDFIALGSTCPHLGCQVHWESVNDRFFCPCHNGVFDQQGKGIGGPPGDAGQELPRYPLKVEAGLLFIEVPLDSLSAGAAAPPPPGQQEA